jgi:hypothetical protein
MDAVESTSRCIRSVSLSLSLSLSLCHTHTRARARASPCNISSEYSAAVVLLANESHKFYVAQSNNFRRNTYKFLFIRFSGIATLNKLYRRIRHWFRIFYDWLFHLFLSFVASLYPLGSACRFGGLLCCTIFLGYFTTNGHLFTNLPWRFDVSTTCWRLKHPGTRCRVD